MRMGHYGYDAILASAAALGIIASRAIDAPAKKPRVTTHHPRNGLVTAEELRQRVRAPA